VIELGTAFRLVVGALDVVGAQYVVVGSTAAAAWGVLRARCLHAFSTEATDPG